MVEPKINLQQQDAAPRRAKKTRMAAPKCPTEKKFRHLCRTKSIDVKQFKEQQTVEQQTVELTTFHPEASSGKRNERLWESAWVYGEKIGDSEVWKLSDSEVWKIQKWKKPVEKGEKADERRWSNRRQSCSSRRQHRSAQNRQEWLHRSAQHRKSSRIYLRRKVWTYDNLKSNRR